MVLFEARAVTKSFGAVRALEGVDITLRGGQVVGLVGDNGAGKSTLVKVLAGVIRADSAQLWMDGEAVSIASPSDAHDLGIETIYQDLALSLELDVAANVFLGREITRYRLPGGLRWLDRRAMEAQTAKLLADLGIHVSDVRLPCESLSGGQRQAVAVARTVLWGHRLILMDEPTAALAVEEQERVAQLILTLRSQGTAVLLISHDLRAVCRLCDSVVVLRQGLVAAELTGSDIEVDTVIAYMMGSRTMLAPSRSGQISPGSGTPAVPQ